MSRRSSELNTGLRPRTRLQITGRRRSHWRRRDSTRSKVRFLSSFTAAATTCESTISVASTPRKSRVAGRPTAHWLRKPKNRAILGVLAILGGALIAAWLAFLPLALHGRADFRQLYVAGAMVRAGHAGEIYDYEMEKKFQDQLVHPEETALPFNHLAYESLLLVPFSMLRYKAAYFAFLALNVAFLALAIAALRPY